MFKNKRSIVIRLLLICITLVFTGATTHPIYVSVTEIQHNAKDKTLEISCKIFTSDFEAILKSKTKLNKTTTAIKINKTKVIKRIKE